MNFDLILKEDESIKDPVILNKTIFDFYSGGDRGEWENKVNEDWEVYNGKIWDTEDANAVKARGEPVYEINIAQPACERLIAQIIANQPSFRVLPRENSDVQMASAMCALGSYIWDLNDGNTKLARGVEDFIVPGMMVLHSYIDSEGEFVIGTLDNREVYFDPNAKEPDGSDSQHIIVSSVPSKEQIQAIYPDFDFKNAEEESTAKGSNTRYDNNARPTYVNSTIHKKYRIIDRYSKVKVMSVTVYDPNGGYEQTVTKEQFGELIIKKVILKSTVQNGVVGQPTMLMDEDKMEYARGLMQQFGDIVSIQQTPQGIMEIPFNGIGVKFTELTIGEAIEANLLEIKQYYKTQIQRTITIGNKLYGQYLYPTNKFPFGIAMHHHSRNPYPYGDMRNVKDLQYQANKTESLITVHQSVSTHPKVLIGRGTANKDKIEQQLRDAGCLVVEVDMDLGEPKFLQPVPLPSELYKNLDDKIGQIERTMGSYSFQDGNVSNAPDTFKGTLALDEMGQRRSGFKRKKIVNAINQLFAWISDMIPYVYTEQKMIRILLPNHTDPKEFIFNQPVKDGVITRIKNDLSANRFDLIMNDDSLNLVNKMARSQQLTDWFERGIIKDNVPILLSSGLPGVDEIIKRQDVIVQQQGMIEQLQNQLKDMEGQVQSLTRENIHKDQEVEVEKFKTKTHQVGAKLEAGTTLALARMGDEVKKHKNGSTNSNRKE